MEQVNFPIKTKITAFLMVIFGIIGIESIMTSPGLSFYGTTWSATVFYSIDHFISGRLLLPSDFVFSLQSIYLIGTFFIVPIFILKRKKWAWWFGTVSLSLSLIFLFLYMFFFFSPPLSVRQSMTIITHGGASQGQVIYFFYPIFLSILLFLDRKNFWKIVT